MNRHRPRPSPQGSKATRRCDSLDFLRLLGEMVGRTGLDIPERDYDNVATLDGLVDYLAAERAGHG